MLYFERKLKEQGYDFIIGVDEAGRGPLAGPVVAAAVLLQTYNFESRIDDSKKLSPKAREKAYFEIGNKGIFGVGIVSHRRIDKINILNATRQAMEAAVRVLLSKSGFDDAPAHIIVDGNMPICTGLPCETIIGGDGRSISIASASIMAKVTRDRIMDEYDLLYPEYGFKNHKGYPTRAHRDILKKLGPCPIHRRSFSYV